MRRTLWVWLVVLAACSSSRPAGKDLPDATLPFIGQGGLVTSKVYELSSFRGKVMVLDLWATWCPPCRVALPLVEKELGGQEDVALVSICTDGHDKPTVAREMMRELAPGTLLLADDGAYLETMKVSEIPHFIVVDRHGIIVGEHTFKGVQAAREFLSTTVAAARKR